MERAASKSWLPLAAVTIAALATVSILGYWVFGWSFVARGLGCADASERLEGIWDPRTRAQVRQVFEERGLDLAAFERAAARLDEQADAWAEVHERACLAGRRPNGPPRELNERRLACLERRRFELSAVAGALSWGSPEVVASLDPLLVLLGPVSICEDKKRLLEQPRPSEGQQSKVNALRHRLAELEVRQVVFGSAQASADLARLVAETEELGFLPLVLEARALAR